MITVIYLPSPSEIFVNEQGHRLVVFKATTAWCSEFSEKQENPTGTHTITRVLIQVLMSQNQLKGEFIGNRGIRGLKNMALRHNFRHLGILQKIEFCVSRILWMLSHLRSGIAIWI
jgi:hypothetical protein